MLIDFFEEFRFDISNKCPLKCSYCTVSSDSDQIMSLDIFKQGMALIESITTKPGRRIQLFGAGEPLCAVEMLKSFFKDYNNDKQFKFELITNGVLLTKENVEFLEKNDIEIHLSLDGIKEIHDKHRKLRHGKGSSWDLIMNNLQHLTKPLTGLICTMSADTIDLMPYMYNSLQKLPATNFFLNFDKYDDYTVLQKEKYLQHLRNFCDRDYKIENNEIIFTGNGASCSNILHCKNYLNPLYFKTFRETAKDLIIGINGELSLDLPQHTSQMAKGARKLGFLKPFGKLGEEIDWDFCSMIEQNYGFHFEHLFFQNEDNPAKCDNCPIHHICQPNGRIGTPYYVNNNCCFYYQSVLYPYYYLKGDYQIDKSFRISNF